MGLSFNEQSRRSEIEAAIPIFDRIELDIEEIRARVLAEFTKRLDAKIKNLQEGEGIAEIFSIDIISVDGTIRGGSGSQRNMPEYIEWRKSVYARDNYTCQRCGSNKNLNAHHLKSWSGHPNLRFDVNNGETLCSECHAKEHPHLKLFN